MSTLTEKPPVSVKKELLKEEAQVGCFVGNKPIKTRPSRNPEVDKITKAAVKK